MCCSVDACEFAIPTVFAVAAYVGVVILLRAAFVTILEEAVCVVVVLLVFDVAVAVSLSFGLAVSVR